MAIIELPDEHRFEEEVSRLADKVRSYTRAAGVTNYVRAAAHHHGFLTHLAREGHIIMPSGRLPRSVKERIALAVSMTNGCDYCIRAHAGLLKKMFDADDGSIVEIAAVTAHANGLAALEAALLIDGQDVAQGLLQPVDGAGDPLLQEIEQTLGTLPTVFRIIARRPAFLGALWNREKEVLLQGLLDPGDRYLIALAAAATRGGAASVRRYTLLAQRSGVDEDALLEAMMVVEAFNKNTAFTGGLRLEAGLWQKEE